MLTDSPLMMEFASFFSFETLFLFLHCLLCNLAKRKSQDPGLSTCDASLCEPEVRALIERECGMVATAEMKQAEVLQRNVTLFRDKFQHVAGSMDEIRCFGCRMLKRQNLFWKKEDKEGCNTTIFDVSLTGDTVVLMLFYLLCFCGFFRARVSLSLGFGCFTDVSSVISSH